MAFDFANSASAQGWGCSRRPPPPPLKTGFVFGDCGAGLQRAQVSHVNIKLGRGHMESILLPRLQPEIRHQCGLSHGQVLTNIMANAAPWGPSPSIKCDGYLTGKLLVASGLIPSYELNVNAFVPKAAPVFLQPFQGKTHPDLLCHPPSQPIDATVMRGCAGLCKVPLRRLLFMLLHALPFEPGRPIYS